MPCSDAAAVGGTYYARKNAVIKKHDFSIDKKIRCTVIGDGLELLARPLRRKGILFDVIIPSCSPLAMAAETDGTNLKYCDDPQMSMPMLLNLRKNLSQMLSRNPENFCQNYNVHPYSTEVRYQNDTDYIIVTNTAVIQDLYQKGNVVYSNMDPQNLFLMDLEHDPHYTRHSFPFDHSFHWKQYYDGFIDAILKEYDSKHILFICSNFAPWYMDSGSVLE